MIIYTEHWLVKITHFHVCESLISSFNLCYSDRAEKVKEISDVLEMCSEETENVFSHNKEDSLCATILQFWLGLFYYLATLDILSGSFGI